MKRILVASILGIAASITSSYGQAAFFFDTYQCNNFSPVRYNNPEFPLVYGQIVPDGTLTDIMWSYGTTTGDAVLAVPTRTIPGYGPGWITGGGVLTAFNYISYQPITFTIVAWSGSDGSYYPPHGPIVSYLSWTEVNGFIAGGPPAVFQNFPGWPVPEPSTFTLAGLSAVALLISRRGKPV